MVRGGSFDNNPNRLRVSYRNRNRATRRNDNQGFRVVASSLPKTHYVEYAHASRRRAWARVMGPGRVPKASSLPAHSFW